jgi:hypothetical protein
MMRFASHPGGLVLETNHARSSGSMSPRASARPRPPLAPVITMLAMRAPQVEIGTWQSYDSRVACSCKMIRAAYHARMSQSLHSTLGHFRQFGWMRIRGAFSAADAAAMCDVIWSGLGKVGIHRHDASTWTKGRPEHLQHLKSEPAFAAIGTARTVTAIDAALEGQAWEMPKDWGAFFLQFPVGRVWDVPSSGWHLDGNYLGRLAPPCGVMVHAMLADVEPRCGGVNILSGSHRLVHKWFCENPAPQGAKAAQLRRSLERHPYLRDLCTAGDPAARITRFNERAEEFDGIPLQVIENTASAGDIILMHSLLLHAAAPTAHLGTQPRFMLSKGFYERYW